MYTYTFTNEQLEETLDTSKIIVLKSLIKEGMIDMDRAEDWCKNHTVLVKEKSFFRTISNLWRNTKKSSDSLVLIIVKRIIPEEDEND